MSNSPIQAGTLRQSVVIQTSTILGTDTRGQPSVVWSPTTTVAAKVDELSGRKLELSRQLVPLATHEVTMRYQALDVNTNRLVWNGSTLNIGQAIDVQKQGLQLKILAIEVLS